MWTQRLRRAARHPARGPALALTLAAAACGGTKAAPPPDPKVVAGVKGYCQLIDVAPEGRAAALDAWSAANRDNTALAALWERLLKREPAALAELKRAAKLALGDDRCAALLDAATGAAAGGGSAGSGAAGGAP